MQLNKKKYSNFNVLLINQFEQMSAVLNKPTFAHKHRPSHSQLLQSLGLTHRTTSHILFKNKHNWAVPALNSWFHVKFTENASHEYKTMELVTVNWQALRKTTSQPPSCPSKCTSFTGLITILVRLS